MNLDDEIWKDIIGYEGLYLISNIGRVKRLGFNKERLTKLRLNYKGYYIVGLCKDGKVKTKYIHQLVAN